MAYVRKLDDFMITDRVVIKNDLADYDKIEGTLRKYDWRIIRKKIQSGETIYGKVVGFRNGNNKVMVWLEDSKHGTHVDFRKKDIKIEERKVGDINFSHIDDPLVEETYKILYGED